MDTKMTSNCTRPVAQREGRHLRIDAGMVGRHIRALRQARGWTQAELAERLGTVARRVGLWETQAAGPSAAMVTRLCAVFGISRADLLAGQ
jgi:transcriptional regulator with XRE-family HTH domain